MQEDVFSEAPPNLSLEELNGLAAKYYGISGDVRLFDGERDQNALISSDTGQKIFLKIANACEAVLEIEGQEAFVSHVGALDPDIPLPRIIPNKNDQTYFRYQSRAGTSHLVRAFSFLSGDALANVDKTDALLIDFGEKLSRLSACLESFYHPNFFKPDFLWGLDNCHLAFAHVDCIDDQELKSLAGDFVASFEAHLPALNKLRKSVLYQDANDYNILVGPDGASVTGIIDFGDMVIGRTANELAIAMAYAAMDTPSPLRVMAMLAKGYARHFELMDEEYSALIYLVKARLLQSICISAHRQSEFPDNEYLSISRKPAEKLFKKLQALDPQLVSSVLRAAATTSPVEVDIENGNDITSFVYGSAPSSFRYLPVQDDGSSSKLDPLLAYIVPYGEPDRMAQNIGSETNVMLGTGLLFFGPRTVISPFNGTVQHIFKNDGAFKVILQNRDKNGTLFHSVFDNLSKVDVEIAQCVTLGQTIGTSRNAPGIDEHWHGTNFQIVIDTEEFITSPPINCDTNEFDLLSKVIVDPNKFLGLSPELTSPNLPSPDELIERRRTRIAPSLSLSYAMPLKIVRGHGAYLMDYQGRNYLDMINNVSHVGHCHPHVVAEISRQAARLNTNSRYLHNTILDYADRLTATLPDPLNVCIFVNAGSEANEVAIRMARAHTQKNDAIAVTGAYHGHSSALIDISGYKFDGPGGAGQKDFVHLVDVPDPYRGSYLGYEEQSSLNYAQDFRRKISAVKNLGREPAFFICESFQGVGGQIIPPKNYLKHMFETARSEGIVCIADEVQVGMGRTGSHMWAFDEQNVIPDIVTIGKPIGNGHPLAAIVTTEEIATSFANGMEYFNTFGGNPVSCAVGMAVLDVIEQEELQQNAHSTGKYLMSLFEELLKDEPLIGDIRGRGLFIGVELVRDGDKNQPADTEAQFIVNWLRHHGVLLSLEGPLNCVLKIKPPIVFKRHHADEFFEALKCAFTALREAS